MTEKNIVNKSNQLDHGSGGGNEASKSDNENQKEPLQLIIILGISIWAIDYLLFGGKLILPLIVFITIGICFYLIKRQQKHGKRLSPPLQWLMNLIMHSEQDQNESPSGHDDLGNINEK